MLDRTRGSRLGHSLFLSRRRRSLHPPLDAVGICEAGLLALGIEEHNQHGTLGHLGLHHQA
ncbi:MAG: hypothetical protein ACXWMH_08655, partial [Syntrophales bacterium]